MEPLPPLTQPVDRYRRLDEVDVLFGDSELTFEGGKAISIGIDDESDPLAAAEWMKFVLGFYNYEREVTATFDGIKDRYECWERKVVAATDIANPTPLIRQNVAFVAYDEETGVWTASVVPRIVNLVGAAGGAIAFNDVTFYNDTELYNALASNSIDVFCMFFFFLPQFFFFIGKFLFDSRDWVVGQINPRLVARVWTHL